MSQNKKYQGNPNDKNKSSNPLSATPYKRKYGLEKLFAEVDPFFFDCIFSEPGELDRLITGHEELSRLFGGGNADVPFGDVSFKKEFVQGTIISETKGGYLVNLGRKYEGFVPSAHCEGMKVGDCAEFYVIDSTTVDGVCTLSASMARGWRSLENAAETKAVLTARVIEETERKATKEFTGLRVTFDDTDLKGIIGYIPRSALSSAARSQKLVGNTIGVTVMAANGSTGGANGRLLLSNLDAQRLNDEITFQSMQTRTIESGTVIDFLYAAKSDKRKSALIRLDNDLIGMLHRSETVSPQDDLASMYKVGDRITVAVRSVDHDRKRIGLSAKLAAQINCLATLEIGKVIEAKILRKVNYGYFASISNGAFEGLIHESDLKFANGRTEEFIQGDTVSVVVLAFNEDGSRLALGRRQLDSRQSSGGVVDFS